MCDADLMANTPSHHLNVEKKSAGTFGVPLRAWCDCGQWETRRYANIPAISISDEYRQHADGGKG